MNTTKKPAKKRKKKLTLAQRMAFQMPIGRGSRADEVVPVRDRMGVRVNG